MFYRMETAIINLILFIIQIILGYIIKSLSERIDNIERNVREIERSYVKSFDELKTLILEIRTDLIKEISSLRNELTEVKTKKEKK